MAQAIAFSELILQGIDSEAKPLLGKAQVYSRGLTLPKLNDNLREWWDQLTANTKLESLPYAQQKELQQRFLQEAAQHEGFSPPLVELALQHAYFNGFKENRALPKERGEPIYLFPNESGEELEAVMVERLSGVNTAAFLRGRTFEVLGQKGLTADTDRMTVTAMVDELLEHEEMDGVPVYTVNIEPASMLKPDFCSMVEQQIKRLGARAKHLCLELTERGRADVGATKLEFLAELRRQTGIFVAYDDYTGLETENEQLALLQPDIVKFDGVLIKDCLLDGGEAGVGKIKQLMDKVCQICPLASLVAEWVETTKGYVKAAALGFHAWQSYVFDRVLNQEPELAKLDEQTLAARRQRLEEMQRLRESVKRDEDFARTTAGMEPAV